MAFVFTAIGLLLLCGGGGAVAYGWPYLVLEYGFTIVITGVVCATSGLVLIGIGNLLKRLKRLEGQLATAIPSLDAHRAPAAEAPADAVRASSQSEAAAVAMAAPAIAAAATGQISPFDKIERALGDVLDLTRGAEPAAVQGADATGPTTDPLPVRREPAREQDEHPPLETVGGATLAGIRKALDQSLAGESEAARDVTTGHDRAHQISTSTGPALSPDEGAIAGAGAPVASDEGVVRVYTIGDSSFTMYADGTIRAMTPEGALVFTTMEQLKTYLDRRNFGAT